MKSSKHLSSNTRGFIFPFVVFIVVAGVFVVSQVYLYNTTNNDYDEFARLESSASIAIEDQATVFRNILTGTNANGTGTWAGADNDDYLVTGSGGSGADDDADAFRYRFGTLSPGETRNILFVDPVYLSYSSIGSLTSLTTLSLSLTSTGQMSLYSLDTSSHVFGSTSLTGAVGNNSIGVTSLNTSDSLALFLTNTSTGSTLSYTLSGSGASGMFSNFAPATYLGGGKYRYYSNILMQDSQGKFLPLSRTFAN